MSNPFGTANLFGARGAATSNDSSYAAPQPLLGLRRRHPATENTGDYAGDENADPNSSVGGRAGSLLDEYDFRTGKRGSTTTTTSCGLPAPPPRASLATAATRGRGLGRPAVGRGGAAYSTARPISLQQQQQESVAANESDVVNQQPDRRGSALVVPRTRDGSWEVEDLSLWVVAYGYRDEAQFRALYRRLESCGAISARRGGLSCLGENERDDDGGNWVAVRYESALCAQKALAQHGSLLGGGGMGTFFVGVTGLMEGSNVAAKLGIGVSGGTTSREGPMLSRPLGDGRKRREPMGEADIMLRDDWGGEEGLVGDGPRSGLDSLCGRVLAWFFMWDTQA